MSANGIELQPITTAVVPESLRFEDFGSKYLTRIDPTYHGNIAFAFSIAERAHRGQVRDTGEPYLSHPLMCTIYLIELGFKRPSFIMATLLHDVPEDNLAYLLAAERRLDEARNMGEFWGYNHPQDFSDLIATQFGFEVFGIVNAVTKNPTLPGVDKHTEEVRHTKRVRNGPPGAWVVKGVDRLHNLRTLPSSDIERVRRKIAETKEGYLPIFEMTAQRFPSEGGRLFRQIVLELDDLEAGLRQPTPEPNQPTVKASL